MHSIIRQVQEQNSLRLLDKHTGLFLEKMTGKDSCPEVRLAGALASAAVASGHVCQPLDRLEEFEGTGSSSFSLQPLAWRDSLLATSVVGRPGETTPLILDEKNRLYLYRFYQYEQSVSRDILCRSQGYLPVNTELAKSTLQQLFHAQEQSDQQLAAALALLKRFVVISGGPGTGKTHTMARMLALVQATADHPLRVALAAPTGKAAARMEEAIRRAKSALPATIDTTQIPESASTLHRLLGYRPDKDSFRYNNQQQLDLDMLVIDEASMIDLPMMYALLQALPQKTRLILLGDRYQLASVEAGSLFSDLCQHSSSLWSDTLHAHISALTCCNNLTTCSQSRPLADCVVLLKKSYRFKDNSGIGSLAAGVNSGKWQKVEATLAKDYADLEMKHWVRGQAEKLLHNHLLNGFKHIFHAADVEEGFAAMERFRCLCAVRKGSLGVETINAFTEQVLLKEKILLQPVTTYQGKPIIIRRNDYTMQLFNGDTGLLWNDEHGKLKAWFKRPDNTLYPVTPARLPKHETAYAITIHKAQGSEFETVLLLLPEEDNRVLSRELLYTGITRARKKLILFAGKEILETAVNRQTVRHSGLADKLWIR